MNPTVPLHTLQGWSKASHRPAKLRSQGQPVESVCTQTQQKNTSADSSPEQHRAECNQESLELRATGDRFYLQPGGRPRLTTAQPRLEQSTEPPEGAVLGSS